MTEFEKLEQEAADNGVHIDYVDFKSPLIKGLYCDDSIALNKNLDTGAEKASVLSEELGHYYTSYGNILDQSKIENRKQERNARLWAYDKMIGLSGIIQGYRQNCRNHYELAECLGVTENFLCEALDCYKEKYGPYIELDGYMIIFEPALGVVEKLK